MRTRALYVLLMAAVGGAACHRARPAALIGCAPVTTPLDSSADLAHLIGTYRVVFVATGGPGSSRSVETRLVLRRQAAALTSIPGRDPALVQQPAVGVTDLDPAALGGVRVGDPASVDSLSPGVAAYVTRRPGGTLTSLVLRVGGNDRGVEAMDGGYFALYVRRLDAAGVWGGWASGGGEAGRVTEEALGYFCAMRVGGRSRGPGATHEGPPTWQGLRVFRSAAPDRGRA